MNPESESPSPSDSRQTRPLWIIAVSLAAIALCLILITIRIQLDRWKAMAVNEANVAPIQVSFEKPDRPPVQRRNVERPRPEISAPETTAPSTSTGSLPPTNVETVPPVNVPAYSGFAAEVSGLPGTNASGGIVGRVMLRGTLPEELPIEQTMRPPCLDKSGNAPINPMFKAGSDGALAEVIVMITAGLDASRFAVPATNHSWVFTNCQVYPFISVLRTGQRINFTGTSHPHSISFLPARNPFRGGSEPTPQTTNRLLQLKCAKHSWETAYMAFCRHPFFAITDTNGSFAIPHVPVGTYTLQAMHRGWAGTNEVKQVISVRADETTAVNFLIDAPEMKMSTQTLSAQR